VEEEGRRPRHPVVEDVRAKAARLGRGLRAAEERDREPAFGIGERHVDGVSAPPALDEPALGLFELVVAELELDRADNRDGDDRDSGDRLGCLHEGREIVLGDDAIEVQGLLAGANRLRVVLARPAAAARGAQDGIWTSDTSRPSDVARRTPVSRSSRRRRASVARLSAPTSARSFGLQSACWAKIGSILFEDSTIFFLVFSGAFSMRTRAEALHA